MSDTVHGHECLFCGRPADHKCGDDYDCGNCCANRGLLAEFDEAYKWVHDVVRPHLKRLKDREGYGGEGMSKLTEEMVLSKAKEFGSNTLQFGELVELCDFAYTRGFADAEKIMEAYAAELRKDLSEALRQGAIAAFTAAELRKEVARLQERVLKYENDEASVCPEDVGFVELIKVLRAEVARLKAQFAKELKTAQREMGDWKRIALAAQAKVDKNDKEYALAVHTVEKENAELRKEVARLKAPEAQ